MGWPVLDKCLQRYLLDGQWETGIRLHEAADTGETVSVSTRHLREADTEETVTVSTRHLREADTGETGMRLHEAPERSGHWKDKGRWGTPGDCIQIGNHRRYSQRDQQLETIV